MPPTADRVRGCVVDGHRFRLPRLAGRVEQLHVTAIGAGWCELTELAPARRLPFDRVRVDARRRFRLPDAPGYRDRWTCDDDEPILVLGCRDPATGVHRVLLLAVRRIMAGLDALRPPLAAAPLRPEVMPAAQEPFDAPPAVPPREPTTPDGVPGVPDGS